MTATELETRLAAVELEIAQLKARIAAAPQGPNNWVEAIAGTFANDPIYDEAMALGRKWRESQRPKLRKVKARSNGSRKRKAAR